MNNSSDSSPVTVDSIGVVARTYGRAASCYDEYSEVFRQLNDRLLQRLPLLAATPDVILDLGCGTGQAIPFLRKRYPRSRVYGLDLSHAMLSMARKRRGRWRNKAALLAADAHQLPLRDASVDLIVSNMMLPWCQQPQRVFAEMYRILTPGGTLLFTTAGPDTLIEYRALASPHKASGRVFGLTDMHDLGDSMLAVGFSAPVLDRENMTISYPSVCALEQELRNTGTVNIAIERRRSLINNRQRIKSDIGTGTATSPAYSAGGGGGEAYSTERRFAITLELVQGHAWKSELSVGSHSAEGDYQISLDSFRAGLGKTKQ